MTLSPGTHVGSYEIVSLIGAGGMGEVYRARDVRIGRDVAVKVLPDDLVSNRDRLARFQREAQSAGSLNHPNLLTIYELGSDDGRAFIVSELLDGVTLRERLKGGALAPRRAIEYATQIAAGLAAAHEHGIVHRDLKPENIFITRDGRLKILDFGLAKVTGSNPSAISDEKTAARQDVATDPGAVLGTAGYMSPEQVRGETVDARSDIFALGAILYEMVSGRRAFHGTSSVDTMHAILHADPPELSATAANVPPALERIINHCLEKNPEQRFQSARDLAFDLDAISATSGESIATRGRRIQRSTLLWIAGLIAVGIAAWFGSRATLHTRVPRVRRITFQSPPGIVATFAPDQQSILYTNVTPGGRESVFMYALDGGGTRDLGLLRARITAVSSRGELAVLLDPRFISAFTYDGTLARVPLAGGAPRPILEHVQWADWTPGGDDLLVARAVGGKARIELPIGNVLYETVGWLQVPKISPDGKSVAFIDHPTPGNDAGMIALLDLATGRVKRLTSLFASMQTLAWGGDGSIWFAASKEGNSASLYRMREGREPDLLLSFPGTMNIQAVARDGRVLIAQSDIRMRLVAGKLGEAAEHELSWLDWSLIRDITPDGRMILFDESGEGGGKNHSVFVRPTDGSPAIRLGDGLASAFSPDQTSVLAIRQDMQPPQIFIYPTGAGETRQVTHDGMQHLYAAWTPDGKSIVFRASDAGHAATLFVQDLAGGAPRALSPPGVSQSGLCSPDGQWVTVRGPDNVQTLYPLHGGSAMRLTELDPTFTFAGWTPDSKHIDFVGRNGVPAPVIRFDLATRTSTLLKELTFAEPTSGINNLRIARDGVTYAYSYIASRSDLYLIEGLNGSRP